MRTTLIGCVSGIALLSGASLVLKALIPNDTQTAASFLLGTCLASTDNLSTVAQLAKRKNWTSMLDRTVPENGPWKVNGMWRVSQNG
jgi:hypothetical protein